MIQKTVKNTSKKIVVANWKMHGNLRQNEVLLTDFVEKLSSLKNTQVVVCAPYPYLSQLQSLLQHSNIAWGAQNVAKNEAGAYTGEVSAAMLCDFGCSYVIIGHSERSTAYCESDENIATKFVQAQKHGLTPILCVGETLIEREAGVMEMVVAKASAGDRITQRCRLLLQASPGATARQYCREFRRRSVSRQAQPRPCPTCPAAPPKAKAAGRNRRRPDSGRTPGHAATDQNRADYHR